MLQHNWDSQEFLEWAQPLLRKAARDWNANGEEAMPVVRDALWRRFPAGQVSGSNSPAYLQKTIYREAWAYFQEEERRASRRDKQGIPHLRAFRPGEDWASDHHEPEEGLIAHERDEAVAAALTKLKPRDRELLRGYFGFDGREFSTTELATRLGQTRQNTLRRIDRALERLQPLLKSWVA
jgi:RNA polymerase sigma factor (sigma-70 family)